MAEGNIDTGKVSGTFTLYDTFSTYFEVQNEKVDTINGILVRVHLKLKALQAVTAGEKKIGKIENVTYKYGDNYSIGCVVNNANTGLLGGALSSGLDVYINLSSDLVANQQINVLLVG